MQYVVATFDGSEMLDVFGPFPGTAEDDGAADSWTARAIEVFGPGRTFEIVALSDPCILDALEVEVEALDRARRAAL